MEWISTEKELPPINVRVIIHFTYKGVYAKYSPAIGWVDKNGWHINDLYVFPADWKITHWMHLPDTPSNLTKHAQGRRGFCAISGSFYARSFIHFTSGIYTHPPQVMQSVRRLGVLWENSHCKSTLMAWKMRFR